MPKIASRRTRSNNAPTFSNSPMKGWRRCASNGITRSFEIMIASATDSTITMAVAADNPPMKAIRARICEPAESGSASTYMSLSTASGAKVSSPASAIGMTNRLIRTR